jgi:hypothetical protein
VDVVAFSPVRGVGAFVAAQRVVAVQANQDVVADATGEEVGAAVLPNASVVISKPVKFDTNDTNRSQGDIGTIRTRARLASLERPRVHPPKGGYVLKIALEPGPSALLTGSGAMVDLQKSRYVLQCDTCDELFEGAEEYTDVWSWAKAEGWEARQVSGRLVLVCPYCASPGND